MTQQETQQQQDSTSIPLGSTGAGSIGVDVGGTKIAVGVLIGEELREFQSPTAHREAETAKAHRG